METKLSFSLLSKDVVYFRSKFSVFFFLPLFLILLLQFDKLNRSEII